MENRPRARKKTVTGSGSVHKRGSGEGGKPVGGGQGFSGSGKGFGKNVLGGGSGSSGSSSGGGGGLRAGGGIGCLGIILVIAFMLFGGGNLLGGGSGGGGGIDLGGLLGGGSGGGSYMDTLNTSGGYSSGWDAGENTGKLNTEVSDQARDKFTEIKGNGKDEVTLMVYMCGTDLESKSAMGTNDLNEMLNSNLGSNVNVIVYTGGCKKWRNSVISNRYNQIYQVKKGKFVKLVEKAGTGAMTDPETLTTFIKYCNKNFPANRRMLIMWDHGSGSASGYGYDENYANGDTMNLGEIKQAIKDAKTTFDFIGFDACLMATYENALALSNYADYLIASEETEPGIGWYYTDWLSMLSDDTSMSTLDLGKQIADDFVAKCKAKCGGQKTTLSVVDLSELSQTVPSSMKSFSTATTELIKSGEYKTVANARGGCREFAPSTRLDQVDFVHLANRIGTKEAKSLMTNLLAAIKYNRTSSNMTNAYGLSIYFPYRSLRTVDSISKTYQKIEMDNSYTSCIKSFAQMQASGQALSGGSNQMPSLFGSGSGGSSSSGSPGGTIDLGSLLGGGGGQTSYGSLSGSDMADILSLLLSGGVSDYGKLGLTELSGENARFLREGEVDPKTAAEYIAKNHITDEDVQWTEKGGKQVLSLSEDQWSNVDTVDKAFYVDDGEGVIELGLDNVYDFDDDGDLVPDTGKDWVAVDGQIVAYYHLDTLEKGNDEFVITGYIPVKYNDQRANLMVRFTDDSGYGEVVGLNFDYGDTTDVEAKSITKLEKGDKLTFLCDYYTYDGKVKNSYRLGSMTVSDPDNIQISNIAVENPGTMIFYKVTDIYERAHWTGEVE